MLIGKGGYGTVYKPVPINCSQSNIKDTTDYVGKFVSSDLIQVNNLQMKRINVDPKNTYTVPLIGICKKTLKNKYHPFWQGNKYNLQLIYPYAGKEFTKLKLPNPVDKWKFFCGFYSFVDFISRMNRMGFYHLDIKEPNILYINNFFKLIDFDLCLTKKEVKEIYIRDYQFKNVIYMYWAPEINFILNNREIIHNITKIPINLRKLFTDDYFKKSRLLKNLNEFFSSDDYKELQKDPSKIDFSKLDLYSIGLIMKIKLYGFDKEIDKLLDKATEFIPSRRYNWPSFLAAYKNILIKKFGPSSVS